jgi:hypothetical protein
LMSRADVNEALSLLGRMLDELDWSAVGPNLWRHCGRIAVFDDMSLEYKYVLQTLVHFTWLRPYPW